MSKRKFAFPALIVSILILTALFYFNKSNVSYDEYIVVNIACLLWIPLIYILFIEKDSVSDYGMSSVADGWMGYKLSAILFVCALPLYIIGSQMQVFQNYYPIQKQAAYDWIYFGYFELTYGMYLFCWEFFFRGFMLFSMSRTIGWFAIIPQAIAFGIMHIGKPMPEILASFGAGIILGIVAMRAKSFLPCFILHWASAFTFDVLIILSKRGVLF